MFSGLIITILIIYVIIFVGFSSGLVFKTLTKIKDKNLAKEQEKELFSRKWKIVAVGAHPDDLEYWLGGTLGKLARSESEIYAVICTKNGGNGDTRKKEQKKAAEVLGYKEVIFLDFPDGDLESHEVKLKTNLTKIFQDISPNIIFAFDVEREGPVYHHNDHEAAGRASLAAAKIQKPSHIYFFHTSAPTMAVDVTDIIDKKIEAFDAHISQKKPIVVLRQAFGDAQLRRMLETYGKMVDVLYAEPLRKGW